MRVLRRFRVGSRLVCMFFYRAMVIMNRIRGCFDMVSVYVVMVVLLMLRIGPGRDYVRCSKRCLEVM